jgi:hypothetical protein
MKTKLFLLMTAFAVLMLAACNKTDSIDQTSVDLADDEAVSDAVFEDVFNSVDDADLLLDGMAKSGDSKGGVLSQGCPNVTVSPTEPGVWPKVITIDFGTGCTGLYEQTRAGKMVVTISGPRTETGSKRTVEFQNYFFNGIKVEGTKVVENMGLNTNQNRVMKVTLTDGKLTLPDGKVMEREMEHEKEFIAGAGTLNKWDDECLITGTASGVNINGVAYTNTIKTALHWKRVCAFIVAGVVEIERTGKEPMELNYGEGECDANATATMNGETRQIILRHRHRNMNKPNN